MGGRIANQERILERDYEADPEAAVVKIAAGEFVLHVVLNVPLGDNDQGPKLVLQTELPLTISEEQAEAFNRAEEEEKEALQRQSLEGK